MRFFSGEKLLVSGLSFIILMLNHLFDTLSESRLSLKSEDLPLKKMIKYLSPISEECFSIFHFSCKIYLFI